MNTTNKKAGRMTTFYWTKNLLMMRKSKSSLMNQPWAAGGLLLACVIVAMLLANFPYTKQLYHEFLSTSLSMSIQSPMDENGARAVNWIFPQEMTIERFVNDILMVVFFFAVGLEIKREVICGELSSIKKALLPIIAAAGGMIVPALIYFLFNRGTLSQSGWGIPTATDIAFALGIMSILGSRVPMSLKVFLTALAIADDFGAILVVALFYGRGINIALLSIAFLLLAFVYFLNREGEKRMIWYFTPAIAVWFLFYYCGIHSTMSGVVMAFMIPMNARYKNSYLQRNISKYCHRLKEYSDGHDDDIHKFPNAPQRHCLRRLSHISMNSIGMSYRLEHILSPWVKFAIMPIFALANAGVVIPDWSYFNIFQFSAELGSVGMGIFFGLLLGKPIGITLASLLAIKSRIGQMPTMASWKMMVAVACLGGIGFTMSLFVDTLSFSDLPTEQMERLRSIGKIAVLMGSISAGFVGSLLILFFTRKRRIQPASTD